MMQTGLTQPCTGVLAVALAALLLPLPAPVEAANANMIYPGCCAYIKQGRQLQRQIRQAEAAARNAVPYSCDLRQVYNQCRQYALVESDTATQDRLHNACESMGGVFAKGGCPGEDRAGLCMDIARDEHKRDIYYDNHYYQDATGSWPPERVRQTCDNLDGDYAEPETPAR